MKYSLIYISLLSIALLMGCTEDIPFEAEYSGASDWAPTLHVYGNNYQRVAITFDSPPRKELSRNILAYYLQYKTISSARFDTLYTFQPWWYMPPYPFDYESQPVLKQNTDYIFRVAVSYRSGVVQLSNEVAITTPIVRGKILKSIPSTLPYYPAGFGFGGRYLYASANERFFRIDTLTGVVTDLIRDLRPYNSNLRPVYDAMTAYGNTAFFPEPFDTTMNAVTLRRMNLSSLNSDTLKLPSPGKAWPQRVTYDGVAIYVLWYYYSPERQQIVTYTPTNGAIIQSYPKVPMVIDLLSYMCADGRNLWYANSRRFDNRIRKFDPATLGILEEHRNPLFHTGPIAWDGANLWAFDGEKYNFVKLQLEGL
jgi:hypothetical protein